ncbi:LEAF RUST 10 DISEASE-RESISTANCE LOCUS RECEPTOR-LIKE PROTEIN KINASE-like 2.1 [Durio zibethinus]|uniref:non-specific serine/threonine protein kinase n=1 Tax=Durio zibethinus TaxID=66656 RepID=A0A6P6AMJ1_DURZI|nr:LEAF RUST 10 DISEASE-RESISTANCE LOCUS RECEPTOR-LIKE PROTEIN KINASE-like 2.1 [Durio zibethinus]
MDFSRSLFSIISIFLLLIFFQVSYALDDLHFTECSPFDCGNLRNFSYPFWTDDQQRPAYCGYDSEEFKLKCIQNQPPVMTMSSQEFLVLYLNSSDRLITIRRVEFGENTCPQEVLIKNSFNYSDTAENITLSYGCRSRELANHSLTCKKNGRETLVMLFKSNENECGGEKVEIPVGNKAFDEFMRGTASLNETLVQPFDMKYVAYDAYCRQCKHSSGRCGSNNTLPGTFVCYCRDRPHQLTCKRSEPGSRFSFNLSGKLAVGFGGAAGCLLIACIIALCFRTKIPRIRTTGFLWKFTKSNQDIEAFIRDNGTLAPKRYSYSDVRKMTNSFKEKLGKGGYGSVYKGKLLDGHLVAVKLLDASKGNGQEFINEVASISRTSHVNVVTLLGFCLEGRKRALIYEFMPNGSLERFIYEENTLKDRRHLTSEEIYRIAIGIARGLEYLHSGCNSRILHFDIKPHNILLDENFCPKISDFGLAKLCTRKDSIVSMLEARGTIGYIAPEVFCRNVGGVSHKSDVYSYGMMILEMAGGRSNVNVGVSETSEIYFPHWIYRHLEQGNIEPELLGLMSREETEIARKMILIGLWCIQINPTDRPSMSKVIEMLEGSIEVLQIPPNPCLDLL